MKIRLLTLVVGMGLVACGGDPKEAKSPESNSGITETSSKEDMPPPPSKEAAPAAATPAPAAGEASAEPTGAAGGMIKIAAIKLTPTKKGEKPVELKSDGTITVDGKPAAKIKGDQVDSIEGTSMLTVGVDGSLVGNGVKPGYKFEGDDVTSDSGAKLTVGDDGSITMNKDGKSEVLGKADGGASAKRAALIMSVLYLKVAEDKKVAPVTKPAGTKTSAPKK